MKRLFYIISLVFFLIPILSVSIIFLGVYFKRDSGCLTNDIYLIIGSDSTISMQDLSGNMPTLPVINTASEIAILNNGKLIAGYNPFFPNMEYDGYYPGYFIIDKNMGIITLRLEKTEYDNMLQRRNIQQPINYKYGYQYLNIPAYKIEREVKNCEKFSLPGAD